VRNHRGNHLVFTGVFMTVWEEVSVMISVGDYVTVLLRHGLTRPLVNFHSHLHPVTQIHISHPPSAWSCHRA
jgi:hypothetical protein